MSVANHPIIFSTESVRAILEGRKTQTRRVIKEQSLLSETYEVYGDRPTPCGDKYWLLDADSITIKCPYGQVGDRLWVRRTKEGKFIWKKAEAEIWLEITGVRVERLQEITEEDAVAEGFIGRKYCPAPEVCDDPDNCSFDALYLFERLWDSLNAKRGYNYDEEYWGNPKIKDGYYQVRFEPTDEYRKVYLRNSEWGITWGWNEYDDPEALELDIRQPESIDIVDSQGIHHHPAKLIRKVRTRGIYSWGKNPWVFVISFNFLDNVNFLLETSHPTISSFTPKRGYRNENTGGSSVVRD